MTDSTDKSRKAENSTIAAAEFKPLEATATTRLQKLRALLFRPVGMIIGLALIVSFLVLGFLLTAKALIVDVEPADAEITIEGGLILPISGNYLLRPGDYTLRATAEGYFPTDMAFRVKEADSQKLELRLQKKPGHLQLTTSPAGATVMVDGESKGQTPLTIDGLSPGEHTLELLAPRHFSLQTQVAIEGLDKTQQLELALAPAWGSLVVTSQPEGATVIVGGETRGVTPLTTELLQQGEMVAVKLAGYKRWERELAVAAGETLNLDTELKPADGILAIDSNPQGANITVDGDFRGVTPAEISLLPGKQHQLRLFLDGYQAAGRTVELASGQSNQLKVTLQPNAGDIRIVTKPKDAEVWIDGKLRGSSGVAVTLPAKAHRLEVRRQGYASKTQTITPRPGLEQVLQVELLTERAARWANTPRQITSPGGQRLLLFKPEQTFTMGASRREVGRRSNEVIKEVRLERGFYLSTTEVTNAQFKAFQRQHSSRHANRRTLDTPKQPVVNISWQQAALYCNWLSEKAGLPLAYQVEDGKVVGFNPEATGYRLPTEAEWAWAARYQVENNPSGGMTRYPWGQEFPPTTKTDNYADVAAASIVGRVVKTYNDGFDVSAPVGSFSANRKGLFDLGGNVSEWINDYYGIAMNLSAKVEVDPLGPEKGEFRVLRGASWRHASLVELRLSYRDYGNDGRDDVGFRVARYAE